MAIEKFHGVAEVHGQRQRGGVKHLQGFALRVGVHLHAVAFVALGLELRGERAHLGGARQRHRRVAHNGIEPHAGVEPQTAVVGRRMAFGGGAGGLAFHNVIGLLGNGVVAGQIGDGGGGNGALIIAAGAGGKHAARHAEVKHLMEMRDGHAQFGGGVGGAAGDGCLRGQRAIHGGGLADDLVEEAGGVGVVELRPLVGGDGAAGGDGSAFPFVARGFEATDDGGDGVWQLAMWHLI